MITRRVKIQLLIFVLITISGVSFVGAKYANLGTLFYSDHYTVTAHFKDSGGIYAGAEVDYRGVKVGAVDKLTLTPAGVDLSLDIKNKWKSIPSSNVMAVVANRSAVGEQYVDLQPCADVKMDVAACPTSGPYLKAGSSIDADHTVTPLPTAKFLGDTATTVSSFDKGALSTSVHELGAAFANTGTALGQILDTSNSFVHLADKNFGVTTALIKDGNTVLASQVSQADAIRSFSRDLSLFTDTLAGSNADVVRLFQSGSAGALELKSFLDQYGVDLGTLISQSLTTGQLVVQNLPGLRQVLVLYPYTVEAGFTVIATDGSGQARAVFGVVTTPDQVCTNGYQSTAQRPPQDGSTRTLNVKAHCAESISQGNPRGAQNAPRAPFAKYDARSGVLTWTGSAPQLSGSTAWAYGYPTGGH